MANSTPPTCSIRVTWQVAADAVLSPTLELLNQKVCWGRGSSCCVLPSKWFEYTVVHKLSADPKCRGRRRARASHLPGVKVLEVIVLRSPHTFKAPKIPAQVFLQKYNATGP